MGYPSFSEVRTSCAFLGTTHATIAKDDIVGQDGTIGISGLKRIGVPRSFPPPLLPGYDAGMSEQPDTFRAALEGFVESVTPWPEIVAAVIGGAVTIRLIVWLVNNWRIPKDKGALFWITVGLLATGPLLLLVLMAVLWLEINFH